MSEDIPGEIKLIDYIQVLRKRKRLVILGTLLCMVVAGGISFMMPKVYEAKTYLMVTSPKYQVEFASKEGSKFSTPIFENISAETFSKIILNEHTAGIVMARNGLNSPPLQYTVRKMLGQIKVEYSRNTNLILLKVQDTSKERAAQIANTWAAAFIERNEEVTSKDTTDTFNFVMGQLEKAKVSLKTAEEDLERFQRANKLELLKEQISGKIKQIVQYESRLDDAVRSQLIEKARYDEMVAQLKEQERIAQPPVNPGSQENVNTFFVGLHDLTAGMTVKEADTFINQQTEKALASLTRAEIEYEEFSQKNRIDILQSQVDRKVGQLADMKLRMTQLDIDLEKQRMAVEKTGEELSKENKYIPIDKGLIGKEEINPLYVNLSSRISDLHIAIPLIEKERDELFRTLEVIEKEIGTMKEELAGQKLEESRLKRRLALAESNYNGLAQKREQSKLSESRDHEKERLIGYTSALYKEIKDSLMKSGVNIRSLHAETLQLKKNIRDLNNEVGGLKKQSAEQELFQTRLIRNVDTARNTFEILSKKGEETKISSAIKAANIQISVPATPPEFPIGPRKGQHVMIAGVAGLLASILLAFFMEFLEKNRSLIRKPD
jgi:uncharacterized protein involved in exopolysaccharide biosynthesis